MVRPVLKAVLCLFLAAPLLLTGSAGALTEELRIEQVQVELPHVRAFVADSGEGVPEGAVATLGGKPLALTELRRYDPALDPTSYFFLVDCSTSTTAAQMEAIKAAIGGFAAGMDANATATLITFGVEVEALLQRESDPAAIGAAVATLAPSEPGTLFFDALARAIELSSGEAYALERKVAFVFSDSADYNLGGYTKEEVDDMLAATGLPFYALGFDTGTKEQLDNFGAVARRSGGAIRIVSEATVVEALTQMADDINSVLTASFDAGTNMIENPVEEFTFTPGGGEFTAAMQVPVRYWQADTEAPSVPRIEQLTAESIRISFSEAVSGANLPESFAVTDAAGDLLGISAAAYDEIGHTVTLTFQPPPPTGEYSVDFPGVTDVSAEANRIPSPSVFPFEGSPLPEAEPEPESDGMPVGFWIFVSLFALVIIIAVAIAAARRKKARPEAPKGAPSPGGGFAEVEQRVPSGGEMQVHFAQQAVPLPRITLHVTGPSGEAKVVELPVNKTLFVGRSDICDVYFDDAAMSRQHFVIGEENGSYTVANLSETGGTTLNGVKISNPRPLREGDAIGAGRQRIVFYAAIPAGTGGGQ